MRCCSLVCYVCYIRYSLFTLSFGVDGRLYSVIVAFPGHLCYYFVLFDALGTLCSLIIVFPGYFHIQVLMLTF